MPRNDCSFLSLRICNADLRCWCLRNNSMGVVMAFELTMLPVEHVEAIVQDRLKLHKTQIQNMLLNQRVAELEASNVDLLECARILAGLEESDKGRRFPTKEDCAKARAALSKAIGSTEEAAQ